MKKKNVRSKIDWKSKFIDLLIVIVGISIAFKLNNWNESIKSEARTKDYIQAFYDETLANQENLTAAVNYAEANKSNIDTLKNILLLKNYDDERIMGYAAGMMGLAQFKPITITMDNITASGEFDLIKDVELRKQLISTYESYNTTQSLEGLLLAYVDKYPTPYFFENIKFSDFSSLGPDFIQDPIFENIVFGYQVLLGQQIKGYQDGLEKINLLQEKLSAAKN